MSEQEQDDDRQLVPFDINADAEIRKLWIDGKWWYSLIDVIRFLTGSPQPRVYWSQLKGRLASEGADQLFPNLKQLKMQSYDGKQRLTDCADTETLLRIIQSVPSPRAEPFKQWLARVGSERIDEIQAPELAADRMRQLYRARGYSDEWIDRRLQSIVTRDELTQEWRERGAQEGREFARLTDILNRGAFDVSTSEHKRVKALKPRDNLRDSMTGLELALTILAEETSKTLHQTRDSVGYTQLEGDAREAGGIAGATRRDIEAHTGQPVVSPENYKSLTARQQQPQLFDEDGAPDPEQE